MSDCFLCKAQNITQSYFLRLIRDDFYFLRLYKGIDGMLVEVCPECHHHFVYDPADLREKYIDRKKIDMRGLKYGK